MLFLSANVLIAQNSNPFIGEWNSTDRPGTTIILKLTNDYTCSFKINGQNIYSISGYKLDGNGGVGSASELKQDVVFYITQTTAASTNALALSDNKRTMNGTLQIDSENGNVLKLTFTDPNTNPPALVTYKFEK